MKTPAMTEGVPLMAVTTVRTRRVPAPPDLVQEDGGGDRHRHADQGGDSHLLERPDDGVGHADGRQRVAAEDLEVLLVLGEKVPAEVGDGLDRHPEDHEEEQPDDHGGTGDDDHGDDTVGGRHASPPTWASPPSTWPGSRRTSRRENRRRPRAG